MFRVSNLRGVTLKTPQFDQSSHFYESVWGLHPVPRDSRTTRYFAGHGAEPWILGLESASEPSLGPLRLGVDSVEDIERASRRLAAWGVALDGPVRNLPGPGGYVGFHFKDPDGKWTELSAIKERLPPRANEARAERMSHIVINTVDARRLADFYVSVLGFTISDWYEHDYIIFLRCGDDHHCLGFSQAKNCSLNHMAFLVDDLESVMKAIGGIKNAGGGVPVWGPGRHGPGGNVFAYFEDPAGFITEYTAELIKITNSDEWAAKEWKRCPENGNVWGTGGPSPRAIALMEGAAQIDARASHEYPSSSSEI